MDDNLISVLMCVYNTPPKYLEESIDSILNQTYRHLQFVIVDDGSDDTSTLKCLKSISTDSRIQVITNEKNLGLTKSLNVGLRACEGKYIARMDADDIALPKRLEMQVKYMDEHPRISLCGCKTILFSENGNEVDTSKEYSRVDTLQVRLIHLLYQNDGFAHPSFMMRRSFLDEKNIMYREDIPKAQDYALTVDFLLAGGEIHEIGVPYLKYRMHEGQISHSSYAIQVECQAKTACRYLQSVFHTLSKEECEAIALMNHGRMDYSPRTCIEALKKMMGENRLKGIYPQEQFNFEFRVLWYHKFMQVSRALRRPWGVFHFFSLVCISYGIREKVLEAKGRRSKRKICAV